MIKKDFYYSSRDQVTKIHGIAWIPKHVRAVLQINHGMQEYIDRYDSFARFLAGRGILVIGNDHLGHGASVQQYDRHGYFHDGNGNECIIGDIHRLRKMTQKRFKDVPYFMLGHSMGSFLTRQYITKFGEGLAGVIIMGTGHAEPLELLGGRVLCRLVGSLKGGEYRSALIDKIAMGDYNKPFEPGESGVEWLTKDRATIDKYTADPWCTFMFSVNAYYHMLRGMTYMSNPEFVKRIPKDVPVFFVSGAMDPVGNFGKGVRKVYETFKEAGIQDVSIRLYDDDRHEILNETDRLEVYNDLYKWIREKGEI